MKISVIVPTYKPDFYLWDCLNSLKNQILSSEEYEVLIILNGEKEKYFEMINIWLEKNKLYNYKLLYCKENGVSQARNLGLEVAKGEYIAFIDDDDIVEKQYLSELLKKNLQLGDKGIAIVNYLDFEKEKIIRTKYLQGRIFYDKSNVRKCFSVVWGKLIPKIIIDKTRFDIRLKNGEDSLFMLQISKNINLVGIVDKNIYYMRRIRKESANFRKKKFTEIFCTNYILFEEYLKLLFKKGYSRKLIFLRILALFKGVFFQIKNKF